VAAAQFDRIRRERLAHKRAMTPDMLEPHNASRRDAFQIWELIRPSAPHNEGDADNTEEEDVYWICSSSRGSPAREDLVFCACHVYLSLASSMLIFVYFLFCFSLQVASNVSSNNNNNDNNNDYSAHHHELLIVVVATWN
jgi:hypothetical protein